jgi:hypothetical protein
MARNPLRQRLTWILRNKYAAPPFFTRTLLYVLAALTLGACGASVLSQRAYAVTPGDWRPGNIIDDVVFL